MLTKPTADKCIATNPFSIMENNKTPGEHHHDQEVANTIQYSEHQLLSWFKYDVDNQDRYCSVVLASLHRVNTYFSVWITGSTNQP